MSRTCKSVAWRIYNLDSRIWWRQMKTGSSLIFHSVQFRCFFMSVVFDSLQLTRASSSKIAWNEGLFSARTETTSPALLTKYFSVNTPRLIYQILTWIWSFLVKLVVVFFVLNSLSELTDNEISKVQVALCGD